RQVLVPGESFPFDFALTDLSGQPISLAGYQGKVLIVDIWWTWCPPCRAEIPSFIKLQDQYGPKGLQIVGINYENTNDDAAKEAVQKFMQENGMNYPCAMGTEAIQQQIPNFGVFPTTIFIDRTGKVRTKLEGAYEYEYLEALVQILLEEDAPPSAPDAGAPPADPAAAPPPATSESGTEPTDAPADGPLDGGQ
ncbi:MAG: TlpA family protein disulfide reductase, partial [Pirellulaceae bacterium]